jgi:hypothetical protein
MNKQDITEYGEQELSLWVQNTEHLYHGFRRCVTESQLRALVDDEFIYTDEQFEELVRDMENEEE